MTKTSYYHGSATEITDAYLQPARQFNSKQTKSVGGSFVTTDLEYAKFFAINRCINGGGQTILSGNKIYLERLKNSIIPNFYVYTVYEPADKPFIHDRGVEYYSIEPVKIAESTKYDTAKEISELGYEIYVLDEPVSEVGTEKTPEMMKVAADRMKIAIQNGKIHRIYIEDIMRLPQKGTQTPKTLYHGSMKEKKEGVVQPFPGNICGTTPGHREDITAVFATIRPRALVYAARHLIMGEHGNCTLRGTKNTLFTTTVNPNISGKIHLYELDSDGFILDQDEEYYCPTEKKILRTITLDVREEIRKGNIKIYVPKTNIDFSKLSEQERDELFVKLKQDINNWRQYNPSDIDMSAILANQGPDR